MRRPLGVTLLGLVILATALREFAVALGFLLAPHLLSNFLVWFHKSAAPFTGNEMGMAQRLAYFCLCCAIGSLYLFFAWGLWRLKNWTRVIYIFFAIADLGMADGVSLSPLPQLLSEKLAPVFWPHSNFVISGMLGTLLNYVAAVIVLAYLLKAPIKQAFGANPAEWKWITGVAAFALLLFAHSLYRSKPEWEAIRWHARHGDHVVLNGVSFPVYYWHAPKCYHKGLEVDIEDWGSGPLRPREDHYMALNILGFREEPTNLTVDQLVDKKIQSYEKAGYTKIDKFSLNIAKQTLGCMREHEFGGGHGAVYCYGDGPIYSVFFTGGERSSKLFDSTMSAAK
jgi:hypothetical protein